jgi:hypothetical protein
MSLLFRGGAPIALKGTVRAGEGFLGLPRESLPVCWIGSSSFVLPLSLTLGGGVRP